MNGHAASHPAHIAARNLVFATAATTLTVLMLTGCRPAGSDGGSSGTGGGAAPTVTQQPPVAGTTGAGEGRAKTGGGGPATGDLAKVNRDLEELASADDAVGSDLGAAASDAAQPDNG
jgi:hypothetical protein